jgi:hypothetical protein
MLLSNPLAVLGLAQRVDKLRSNSYSHNKVEQELTSFL